MSLSLRTAFLLAAAGPLLGQFSGPAILGRGQAPSSGPVSNAPLSFRPYIGVNTIYDNGMLGLDSYNTTPGDASAFGTEGTLGAYLGRSWKRTLLDLDYRGTYRHYSRRTMYDGTDQLLSLSLARQTSRHTALIFRESAGTFTRDFLLTGTGFLNSSTLQLPSNEILDNRVFYVSTAADFRIEKSARLSFDFGANGFLIRRRATSVAGAIGVVTSADMAYRLSRRSTVVLKHQFTHFDFNRVFGASNLHTVTAEYDVRLTRQWEVGMQAGAMRIENLFLARVTLAPEIAQILGTSSGIETAYQIHYYPTFQARLTRLFRRGSIGIAVENGASAGNGVYLTSRSSRVMGNFGYTVKRVWFFGVRGGYDRMAPLMQSLDTYGATTAGVSFRRRMSKDVYLVGNLDFRQYNDALTQMGLTRFGQHPYRVTIGFTYSPASIPVPSF